MNNTFVKVMSSAIAENLRKAGFTYIKEQHCYAFTYSKPLMEFLMRNYEIGQYVCTNRLTF